MKKIAFITPAFTDSTVPLIKKFLENGNHVDLFFLSKKDLEIYPAFNGKVQENKKLITEVDKWVYSELNDYFGNHFNAYAIRLNRPYKNVPVFGDLCKAYRNLLIDRICTYINAVGYDGIYVLSLYDSEDTLRLCKKINGNIIVGLHEVCNHTNPNFDIAPTLISFLSKKHIPIVVYSSKSKQDLLKYKVVNGEYVHETRFGKYDSYPMFAGKSALALTAGYFLLMGNIKPYKGLDFFIASALKMLEKDSSRRFVIAGNGYDSSLDLVKENKNFTIINRFISNEELVDLIAGCAAVVCPYKSASQSGIIQSAYAFNKPVVVSDLESFRECVVNHKTGEFCKVNDIDSLEIAMNNVDFGSPTYSSLVDNITHIDDILKNYSWNKIYDDYKFFWD